MNRKRILLLEAEEKIADSLYRALDTQEYTVDLVSNGSEGKRWFRTHSYDLALVALHLPDMSGYEISHYIRRRNAHIPLVLLTSGPVDHEFEGVKAGINEYIVLSADCRELLARIHMLIKRLPFTSIEEHTLAAGDIILDLDSKEVTRAGEKISLTAREFLLLEYLIRNKNRIVTRSEIVCAIWGDGFPQKERRIAAYMNSLRRKMEQGASRKYIYTATGRGYLLSEAGL